MIPTFSEHRNAWFNLYLAAIHTGRTPEGAAEFADEAVRHFANRWETLSKIEKERDRALSVLSTRNAQIDVGIQALLALVGVRDRVREMRESKNGEIVRQAEYFSMNWLDGLVSQLHEINRTYIIIPRHLGVPKPDDHENPLFPIEGER